MASLIKFRHINLMHRCLWNHMNKVSRGISTSKKNSDTATTTAQCPQDQIPPENWVSYGFDYKDKTEDTNAHHASFFFSVTLCLVFGSFMWAYAPDVHMRDWAQREAFLELRRREMAGKQPICPHYVDPNTVKLPSEEELGDTEIII